MRNDLGGPLRALGRSLKSGGHLFMSLPAARELAVEAGNEDMVRAIDDGEREFDGPHGRITILTDDRGDQKHDG